MQNLVLPRSSATRETDSSIKYVDEILFVDGTTVFDYQTGSINHVQVILNPDSTPEHPPTNEMPLVRGLMSFLYTVGWSSFFRGEGIHEAFLRKRQPEDTEFAEDVTEVSDFNRFVKDDCYNDYKNTVAYLTRIGLLQSDHLDDSAYEILVLEP